MAYIILDSVSKTKNSLLRAIGSFQQFLTLTMTTNRGCFKKKKSLKYETRQLTSWKEDGSVCGSRKATVQYLKDLRQRCKERGLDSGLKATDLILIYF